MDTEELTRQRLQNRKVERDAKCRRQALGFAEIL
jgi:hypothetical protein